MRPASAVLTELAAADAAYRHEHFITLEELCRARARPIEEIRSLMREGKLPQPAYVDERGDELVRPDYLELLDQAGSIEKLPALFEARYRRAAEALDDATALAQLDAEWEAFLRGTYGVCLRHNTPENIVRKDHLMRRIEALLEQPARHDAKWQTTLRAAVNGLDSLEMPFAPLDEYRLGTRPSRRRLVEDVRARYPEAFSV